MNTNQRFHFLRAAAGLVTVLALAAGLWRYGSEPEQPDLTAEQLSAVREVIYWPSKSDAYGGSGVASFVMDDGRVVSTHAGWTGFGNGVYFFTGEYNPRKVWFMKDWPESENYTLEFPGNDFENFKFAGGPNF